MSGLTYPVLSSDWTGLSRHLIASFFPVRRIVEGTSVRWEREPNSVSVEAPLTDGTIDQTANWTSPFENQTADAKLSTLSALLQSGGLESLMASFAAIGGGKDGIVGGKISEVNKQLTSLMGKTAVTKLNSTQIFSGMPPLKITATAHFRALYDADIEVRKPMQQLMQWALPKKLSADGLLGIIAKTKEIGLEVLYPSESPQVIGMIYADAYFVPMVIESMPQPLTGPRDRDGRMLHAAITFTLGSLHALDKDDWAATRRF